MLRSSRSLSLIFAFTLCGFSCIGFGQETSGRVQLKAVPDPPIQLRGEIDSSQRISIRNKSDQSLTVVNLAENGSKVKKGDLLVEFDSSALQGLRLEAQIVLQQVDAKLKSVEREQSHQQRLAKLSLQLAEQKTELANSKYELVIGKDGEIDLEKQKNVALVEHQKSKLKLLENRMKKLDNPNSDKAFEIQLAIAETKTAITVAESKLKMLDNQKSRLSIQLKTEVIETEIELASVRHDLEAVLNQAKSKNAAVKQELNAAMERLKAIDAQIRSCVVRAPQDGVFYHSRLGRIEEGAIVRSRQTVGSLPDLSSLCVNLDVSVNDLSRIKKGQKVEVKVGAYPDATFDGTVATIGELPNRRIRGATLYPMTVKLSPTKAKIRIGSSAYVKIER